MPLLHATCVDLRPETADGLGVLLTGRSGSGKSDLALRLLAEGARLVADDQVELTVDGDGLLAAPPAALAGLLEVRGLGIVRVDWRTTVRLRLLVELVAAAAVPRLPPAERRELAGVQLPVFRLAPFEASATARLRAMALSLHRTIIVD